MDIIDPSEIQRVANFLNSMEPFAEFSLEELSLLTEMCQMEVFEPQKVIFKENSPGEEMFVILSGEVYILKEVENRQEILSVLKTGDFFGEMSLLDGSSRSATAIASKNEATKLLVISRLAIDTLSEVEEKLACNLVISLVRTTSRRIRVTLEKLCISRDKLEKLSV